MSKLASALLAFQKQAPSLHRDSTNPHFRNKYLSLEGLMTQVLPALNAQGLVLMQFPAALDGQPALRTKLLHAESGEFEEDVMPLMLAKNDPQAQGSGLTYARRYAAMSVLGLVADEDDDGNAASRSRQVDGVTGGAPPDENRSPAGEATQPPAPSSSFTPPPAVQEELDRKQSSSTPPGDGGVPELVQVTFGKHRGSTIGDLLESDPGYVKWLAEKFEPRNPEAKRIRGAAITVLGGKPEPVAAGGAAYDESIPFQVTF